MIHNAFLPRYTGPCIALLVASVGLGPPLTAADPPDAIVIPTEFNQDRFFAVPSTPDGRTLRLIADTGGGMFLFSDSAERQKLEVFGVSWDDYKGLACHLPAFADGKGIPSPGAKEGVIPVAPAPVRLGLASLTQDIDGILGESWFADRVWTFDFAGKKILFHPKGAPELPKSAVRVEMGLRKSTSPARPPSYPRIQVTIAGEKTDVLLSTGCVVARTADALKELGGVVAIRGASLISNSTFDRWKKEHRDWRIVANAEEGSGEPMIEVPDVSLAGIPVGKVWFTQRPDSNFRDNFSQWMDRPVDGAIGPNALRGLCITLDYPNRTAWFEKP